jgi:hypothetical protein
MLRVYQTRSQSVNYYRRDSLSLSVSIEVRSRLPLAFQLDSPTLHRPGPWPTLAH